PAALHPSPREPGEGGEAGRPAGRARGDRRGRRSARRPDPGEEHVLSTIDPASPAAKRGLSDISIRNLFIVPTIRFPIVFNIFPLIYSLGYSFTDFRASSSAPASFVGLQNYRDLLNDDHVWNNFSVTAKYVLLSVGGQVLVGFGVAMLLNREIPYKGLITTLL